MLQYIERLHRLSRVLVWVGGVLILGSAFLVTGEVFARRFFNVSLAGADEISGYAFAVATTLGFAYALFERAHIRVDALIVLLPRVLRLLLSFIGLGLLVGFAAIVTWQGWDLLSDTLKHGSRSITPLRTPLAVPQIPWLLGWAFFVFCGVSLFVAALLSIWRRDAAGAESLIGVKTLDEQIEDETV